MDPTLLIGIAVVALGTGVGALMMFGQRANSLAEASGTPGTIPVAPATSLSELSGSSAQYETPEELRPPVPRGLRSTDVHIRWYQRLRAGLGLLLITVGIGMAFGAVLGLGALALSLFLG